MKRLVTIELHSLETEEAATEAALLEEDGDVAVPGNRVSKTGQLQITNLSTHLKDDDRIIVRILKPRKSWGLMKDPSDEDDDDSSSDGVSSRGDTDVFAGWIEYRRYDLDEIEDVDLDKESWEATVGRASNMERRELKFESEGHGRYILEME